MIAQLNCFTFGYLFVELVVGSPVGMGNFLSGALASARSRLSPIDERSDENPPKSARKVPFFILWPELRF